MFGKEVLLLKKLERFSGGFLEVFLEVWRGILAVCQGWKGGTESAFSEDKS